MSLTRRTRFSAAIMSAGIAGLVASALIAPAASAADGPVTPTPAHSFPSRPPPAVGGHRAHGPVHREVQGLRPRRLPRSSAPILAAEGPPQLGAPTERTVRAAHRGRRVGAGEGNWRRRRRQDTRRSAGARSAYVAYAEPDFRLQAKAANPDDPAFGDQWNLSLDTGGIGVTRAWDVTKGAGQVVAVIDTGITKPWTENRNVLDGFGMIADPAISRRPCDG